MKKKYLMMMVVTVLALSACGNDRQKNTGETQQTEVGEEHNAQNSLDYQGIYKGTIALNGSIDSLTIQLDEKSYVKMVKDSIGDIERMLGTYTWNKAGNTITLEGAGEQNQFFVGENTLLLLDKEGKKPPTDQQASLTLQKK